MCAASMDHWTREYQHHHLSHFFVKDKGPLLVDIRRVSIGLVSMTGCVLPSWIIERGNTNIIIFQSTSWELLGIARSHFKYFVQGESYIASPQYTNVTHIHIYPVKVSSWVIRTKNSNNISLLNHQVSRHKGLLNGINDHVMGKTPCGGYKHPSIKFYAKTYQLTIHLICWYSDVIMCANVTLPVTLVSNKMNVPFFSTLFQWDKNCNCFQVYFGRNYAKIFSKFWKSYLTRLSQEPISQSCL